MKNQKKKAAFRRLRLAESERFELSIRFWRIHDFQSCSFGHSDNSPLRASCECRKGQPTITELGSEGAVPRVAWGSILRVIAIRR